MTNAWEVTFEDIEHVLIEHGKSLDETELILDSEFIGNMDYDRVEKAILYYTVMTNQIQCSHSEIEDILIENDVLDGPKLFHCPR